jgi:CRISPR-associated protein Cmr5
MNRRRIERLIPNAMNHLERLRDKKSGKIPKVYDSYIAAFGPAVISSGLLQCVKFYEGDEKRKKVTNLFFTMLKEEIGGNIGEKSLSAYLEKSGRFKDHATRSLILDISVACKLSIRTFELDESKKD